MGDQGPLGDAFLRAARPVVELYSARLAALGLTAGKANLVVTLGATDQSADDVRVTVWTMPPRDMPGEMAFVHLCPSVGRLDAAGRARLVLEVVHRAAEVIVEARGGDPELLGTCRAHVLDSDWAYHWAGPWKVSPDRRHRARAVFRLAEPDGWGRAILEIAPRGDDAGVARSPEQVAFCTSAGFVRSARTVTWHGSSQVRFTPYKSPIEALDGAPLTAMVLADEWTFAEPPPVAVRTPEVRGAVVSRDAPVPAVRVVVESHRGR